ncbi:MAG: hypothetical protein VX589_03785 [Myxococcota bacterium]|nr:hypothetical protein [Myxococcota bacterium]
MAKDTLKELHAQLEVLRVEFERFFMGLERRMPSVTRERLSRQIRRFDTGNDSVLRFRHRNLVQRLMVLEQYWNRTMRAMEAGTYSRDIARADFRANRRTAAKVDQLSPTTAQTKAAQQKAKEVGAEADAFLQSLTQPAPRPTVPQRGQPLAETRASEHSADATKRPSITMRGRSKKG